uniref:Thrombospondin type-1 domain-containing protein 7A n=1 Tax=Electrophorus electricus TaxID=8005 RepID=A0A4W4FBY4_ELEEL
LGIERNIFQLLTHSAFRMCMGSECGLGGSQSRAVWCAHVEGWTTLPTNCLQGVRPANQQSCFRVCDWHRELYDWQVGTWGRCMPVAPRSAGEHPVTCSQAEEGIQTREVRCALRSDGSLATDTICEYFEPRPLLEQACLIPCPRDCVVSYFSPWTACSKTCGLGLQNRARSVLTPPQFGGLPCPNLTEFRTCAPRTCDSKEAAFSLRVGAWGVCTLAPTPSPTSSQPASRAARQARRRKGKGHDTARDPETRELIKSKRNRNRLNRPDSDLWNVEVGFQQRQVACQNVKSLCSHCPHWSLPDLHQSCLVPKACVLSEWAEWGPCSKTCTDPSTPKGTRSRSRQLRQLPVGGRAECPLLEERQPCEPLGDSVPPCATYAWRTTEWGECRVDVLLSQQDRRRGNQTGLCGGGLQVREVYCVQANEELLSDLSSNQDKSAWQPVDRQLCAGPVLSTSQLCRLSCPIECEVSPWGAWGPCTFENCDDQTVKKGFKFRRRKITNYPTGGEGSCPHLVEAVPCDEPSCFNWRLLRLEECVPNGDMYCGPGTQLPQVLCVNNHGKEVSRELCNEDDIPVAVPCVVPCPKDCVLSPWTAWSTCSQTCSSKTTEGKQMRTRAILAYNAREGGANCPNASTLQEVRGCNEHACVVYHWQTGPWGPCTEDPSLTTLNSTTIGPRAAPSGLDKLSCPTGMQTRKVICVKVNVGQVPPKKCPEAPRPPSVRPCVLPCKKDCIVTPFSEWSACPVSCEPGDGGRKSMQSRFRIVIQRPAYGGLDCPEVLYEERECESLPLSSLCPGYRWKTHKWRRCQMVPWSIRRENKGAQETCGVGLQTRAVSCRQLDSSIADVDQCLKFAGSMPAVSQQCQLPCRDDCQLTIWSKFSSCTADCVGVRTRRRALVGKSKRKDKCKNGQVYPLSETQYCPCDKYNAQPVGNWSDCILPEGRLEGPAGAAGLPGVRVHEGSRECGQGYRYQAVVCYDQGSRLVETSRCNSHGYIEEACVIPCPSDCKLSEWSNWSRCSKSCGSGVKVRSKWLREKPYNGGRPCPKLDHISQVYEVVPCVSDCSQYMWVAEPWSAWKVSNMDLKENCGDGVQTRRVRCMLNTADGPTDTVEDYLCDPEEMPPGTRESRLPCPEDCVLSDWSPWTPCELPCSGRAERQRTAYTLRLPKEGRDCPRSTEAEPCVLNRNCHHYSYNITDWSTCQLSANAVCGNGLKTRMLDCVRSDGKSVDLKFCKELGLERTWRMNTSCAVECPVNCQLSEWSPWTECSQSCGLEGKMFRRRTVLQASQGDGRPCPRQLEQWKPCPVRPCYRWQYSPWSECRVEDVVCGEGRRFRNLSCFVSDGSSDEQGSRVDEELCASLEQAVDGDQTIILEEACTLPCPGDCYLMEWSDWSVCQGVCVRGQHLDVGAVQVRSRAAVAQEPENIGQCPEQEWQSRPYGECFKYRWVITPGLIWCERSDGTNVTGTVLLCLPVSLPETRSASETDGLCMCEEGYTEVLSAEGQLEQCTQIPVLEIPTAGGNGADVKTSQAVDSSTGTTEEPGRPGRTWYLQPFGPDGKLKTWVYGVAAGGFVLLVFLVSMTYLACKKPKKPQRRQNNNSRLKPLTLAYDGDADM